MDTRHSLLSDLVGTPWRSRVNLEMVQRFTPEMEAILSLTKCATPTWDKLLVLRFYLNEKGLSLPQEQTTFAKQQFEIVLLLTKLLYNFQAYQEKRLAKIYTPSHDTMGEGEESLSCSPSQSALYKREFHPRGSAPGHIQAFLPPSWQASGTQI